MGIVDFMKDDEAGTQALGEMMSLLPFFIKRGNDIFPLADTAQVFFYALGMAAAATMVKHSDESFIRRDMMMSNYTSLMETMMPEDETWAAIRAAKDAGEMVELLVSSRDSKATDA